MCRAWECAISPWCSGCLHALHLLRLLHACACPGALWGSRHPAAQAEQQQPSSASIKTCILGGSRCAANSQIPLFILFFFFYFRRLYRKGSPNWENLEMGVPTCSSRTYECLIDELLHRCFAELQEQDRLQLVSPFHIHTITESQNGLTGKDP